jgi:hypothetical protein
VKKCETIDFLCGSPIHPKLQVDGEKNNPTFTNFHLQQLQIGLIGNPHVLINQK